MLIRTDKYGGSRFYYETEAKKFYISATTFCAAVLPEAKHLTKWKQDLGFLEANRRAREAADYGTLMHIIIENFLQTGSLTWKKMDGLIRDFIEEHNHKRKYNAWCHDLKKDVLAFAKFATDRKLEVISTEQWAILDLPDVRGGIAGTVDLIGHIKWGRGMVRAIIDMKSGRKGFYDAHALQLALYKKIIDGMCDTDHYIFNWAPKDWRSEPTYDLKDQSNSPEVQKLDNYIDNARIDNLFTPKFERIVFDQITLGDEPQFSKFNLHELIEMEER